MKARRASHARGVADGAIIFHMRTCVLGLSSCCGSCSKFVCQHHCSSPWLIPEDKKVFWVTLSTEIQVVLYSVKVVLLPSLTCVQILSRSVLTNLWHMWIIFSSTLQHKLCVQHSFLLDIKMLLFRKSSPYTMRGTWDVLQQSMWPEDFWGCPAVTLQRCRLTGKYLQHL